MMQRSLTAIFLALAPVGALTLAPAAPAHGQQIAVSVSLFHRELAPHGRWFQHPRHGWAWFPTTVDAQWRPYSRGQWVWTEEHGWYWNSDEPFGWATYHYGRWGYDEVYGWVWIPGSKWGPAWVAFRYSEGHVGWAPLPPETLEVSFGFNASHTEMSARYYEPRWVFVPRNRFLDGRIYTIAAPQTQNNVYIRQTVNVTNYVTVNNVIVNRSIDRRRMETALGRRIEVARVKDVDEPRKYGRHGDKEIDAYRPQVRMSRDAAPPEAARAKPDDKPRYSVHKDATAPSERRGAPDEKRGATPAQPAHPPTTARGTPDEKRGAMPAQPPATSRGVPAEKRKVTPAQPTQPPAAQGAVPDEKRGATPVQPPAAPGATPDEKRGATPAQPQGRVAPSAPPSQATPQPPQRGTPPAKTREAPKKREDDEKKRDEKPVQ